MNYPMPFGADPWFDTIPLIAPFWGLADEAMLSLISDDWPEARTSIYHHVYERTADMDQDTIDILARAETDVKNSGEKTTSYIVKGQLPMYAKTL